SEFYVLHRISHSIVQAFRMFYLEFLRDKGRLLKGLLQLPHRGWKGDVNGFLFLDFSSQVYQLPWNLTDKAGSLIILGLSPDHPLLGAGKGQFLHGPCDSHIAETSFFLQLSGVICGYGHIAGENAVFYSSQKYIRKFQTLCTVQSHQQYLIIISFYRVDICDQRNLFQETGKGRI